MSCETKINFCVLTLFPELIEGGLCKSMIRRAIDNGIIGLDCINPRDFAQNKHKRVDDYPYGGGAGMVMQAQPVYDAYAEAAAKHEGARAIYLTPQGAVFNQQKAAELAGEKNIIFICGHYEGIDERVIDEIRPEELSIGDYILTGGELAALVVIDAVSRLVAGVLGKEESHTGESFSDGVLEYPQYTRPPVFMGRAVPEVLLSGHHQRIDDWRRGLSIERTLSKRPDLRSVIMTRYKLNIEGMTCAHCARHVSEALQEIGGKDVRVDLDGKLAYANFDRDMKDEELNMAIDEAGYELANIAIMV